MINVEFKPPESAQSAILSCRLIVQDCGLPGIFWVILCGILSQMVNGFTAVTNVITSTVPASQYLIVKQI